MKEIYFKGVKLKINFHFYIIFIDETFKIVNYGYFNNFHNFHNLDYFDSFYYYYHQFNLNM
jgi:hypothetical protein